MAKKKIDLAEVIKKAVNQLTDPQDLKEVEAAVKKRLDEIKAREYDRIVVHYRTRDDGGVVTGGVIYRSLDALKEMYPEKGFQLACVGPATKGFIPGR